MAHIAVPINEDVKENSLQKSFTFDYITGSRHELRQEPVTMAQQRPSQKRRQCVREFMCLCETEWHEHQRAKLYISASVIRATYISSRSVSPPDGFTICLESKPLLELLQMRDVEEGTQPRDPRRFILHFSLPTS